MSSVKSTRNIMKIAARKVFQCTQRKSPPSSHDYDGTFLKSPKNPVQRRVCYVMVKTKAKLSDCTEIS